MNQSEKVLLNSRLINQVKEANNFDFIRFFLAYSVMFNHFSTLTETDPFWFVSGGFRVKGFFISKHSKKCTFYILRFGCSFAAVNTIKPQLL